MVTAPPETEAPRNAGGESPGVSAPRERGVRAGTLATAESDIRLWRRARVGLWRVAVAEESMTPALRPGDWLLLDPTSRRWPRRGSVVVFREPDSGILAIKRVAARPGDRVRIAAGLLHLGPDEAWLLGDNAALSLDSRRYGPVPSEALVGRAWFRYGPPSRIGPVR